MNVKTLNAKIDEFVSNTMSFLNNIQVYHWQTQSYSEHEALGEYYETLTQLNDKLVESWQGNQNTRLKFSEGPYSLQNYFSKEETKNMINDFKNQVTQLSGFVSELNESNSFDDIENILATLHILILLTLRSLSYHHRTSSSQKSRTCDYSLHSSDFLSVPSSSSYRVSHKTL